MKQKTCCLFNSYEVDVCIISIIPEERNNRIQHYYENSGKIHIVNVIFFCVNIRRNEATF